MKRYFAYNPEDGKVASYSEAPIVANNFEQIEIETTPEQEDNLSQNYELHIKGGQLICIKPKMAEKRETIEQLQNKLMSESITIEDIANTLILIANGN